MSASTRVRWASLVLLTAALAALTAVARGAESPVAGGTVPSVLALSLSEPSPFKRVRTTRGGGVFVAGIRAEATATDLPVRLSVADGEATGGRRLGHMASRGSILSAPLFAAADGFPYRSLDTRVPAQLRRWSRPLTRAAMGIRLRQHAPSARAVRNHRKLLFVTLTAGGP